jgi:hypothetical protein
MGPRFYPAAISVRSASDNYELSTGPFVSLEPISPPIVNAHIFNYNTDVEFSMYAGLQHHQVWVADHDPLNQPRGTGTWELVSPAPVPDTNTTFAILLLSLAVLALAARLGMAAERPALTRITVVQQLEG